MKHICKHKNNFLGQGFPLVGHTTGKRKFNLSYGFSDSFLPGSKAGTPSWRVMEQSCSVHGGQEAERRDSAREEEARDQMEYLGSLLHDPYR